ncbi:MAG: LptF/LptG family permease [Planctomycetota bacterium]
MKKLDRYVGRNFLWTYGVCFTFFLGIYLIIDFIGKSNDYIKSARELSKVNVDVQSLIVSYYLMSLPWIYMQIAPFITAMAAMFTMARLRHQNELVPMVFGGTSLYRVILPILFLAVGAGALMFGFQEWLVPRYSLQRTAFEYMLDKQKRSFELGNISVITDEADNVVFVGKFDVTSRIATDFVVTFETPRAGYKSEKLRADQAQWLDEGRFGAGWYLTNGRRELIGQGAEEEEVPGMPGVVERLSEDEDYFGDTDIQPEDLVVAGQDSLDLSLSMLIKLAERYPHRLSTRTLIHRHITYPLANVILVLLGIPWVLRFESRSLFWGVGFALLICLAYFAADLIGQEIGRQAIFDPAVCMWMPTIFFGSLGIVFFMDLPT